MRAAALLLVALALGGCETTAEESARLERAAGVQAGHGATAAKGLSITRAGTTVRVLGATLLHGSEGAAAAVTLLNLTDRTLVGVPIALTVRNAAGATVFQNNSPGLEAALVSVPSLAPHAELTWVNDQIPANGDPSTVTALAGESATTSATLPAISLSGVHRTDGPSGAGAAGSAGNPSAQVQHKLVVFAVARRGGRIVAAGRAVVPELAAHSSTPFEVFFIGQAAGSSLDLSAPATSAG